MKAIWKGSLTFGLINIPVSIYPASDDRALEFHMLHKKEGSPIRFVRFCQAEDKEVPYNEIIKGYEYEKGKFVILDEEDFKAVNAKKTSTLEIQHFSKLSEIDPIYFEKPYFLEPDKKAVKAYQLLNEALKKSEKVAIANYVFKSKEHIGAIIASPVGLTLIQMRYHAEIRSASELQFKKEKTSDKELEMAIAFIDQSTVSFKAEKYHDTYTEELIKMIERKLKGNKRISASKVKKEAPTHATNDLMGLLQASLKKSLNAKKTPQKKKHSPFSSLKKTSQRKRA